MTPIVSRSNRRFQAVRRLVQSAATRRRAEQAFIEGIHLCQAYLAAGAQPRAVVCSVSALAHPEASLLCRSPALEEALLLSDELFGALSPLESAGSVAFIIDVPAPASSRVLAGDSLVLDRLQDPGNVGSILRSAAAAGVREVFFSVGTVDAWSPKVVRAAMGAHFALTIVEDCDPGSLAIESGVRLLATSSHAPTSLFDMDLSDGAIAWVLGHEGQGVAPELLARCESVRIPQPGGQESLNVAAAAAICLFEQVRQRGAR